MHSDTYVSVLPLYLCFSIFVVLCSGLAPLDINQGRNDGAILNAHPKHTLTHTLIHRRGFSSALRGDRVVCLVLIGAIQAIQHGERARETDTEGERERGLGLFSFFFPGGNLLSTRFWILKKKKKTTGHGSYSVSQVVNRYFLVILHCYCIFNGFTMPDLNLNKYWYRKDS